MRQNSATHKRRMQQRRSEFLKAISKYARITSQVHNTTPVIILVKIIRYWVCTAVYGGGMSGVIV